MRRIGLALAVALVAAGSARAEGTAQDLVVAQAIRAAELCAAANIDSAAVEAAFAADGWPAFEEGPQGVRVTYRPARTKKSDPIILAVGLRPTVSGQGLRIGSCSIAFQAKLAPLAWKAVEARFTPGQSADAAIFLRREAGSIRPMTLMEMIDALEVAVARYPAGDQQIMMTVKKRGKVGALEVTVYEKAAAAAGAPAQAPTSASTTGARANFLATMGRVQEPELSRRIEAAAGHPLGSERNPVRVSMVAGERNYLARLRCSDGAAPAFQRIGSMAATVYGSIMDGYDVVCAQGQPAKSMIYMDMYHPEHRETAAPPGFTLAAEY